MPTSHHTRISQRIAAATQHREHHLMQACKYDEEIDRLKVSLGEAVPDDPVKTAPAPARLTHERGGERVPLNTKMTRAQIPDAIELLDTGIGWRETAKKFDLKPQSLQERVYRYLIDEDMLTPEIVQSIWGESSYRHLSNIYGLPIAAEPAV